MANTHPCPSCDELVDSEASVCPHCGATLSGSVLTLQEEASSAQNTEPIAAPPASQAPLGINLASDNDNALVPPPQKPDHAHRPSNPWWTVAFATLGVILILGTIFLLAHQPTTPAVVAPHPTATTAPSPTATSIPQAHVVIQLENVFSKDSRDFFSADSFYIKSTLSAPGTDREISSYKVTNHYNINQGETTNFGAGDQVIFDANILLSGNVTGSMSAYTNDDNNPLGSTDIKFSAGESSREATWHITGRSIFNFWEFYVHYSISINKVATTSPANIASIGNRASSGAVVQAADVPSARRWGA